jgi:hypothetical protein
MIFHLQAILMFNWIEPYGYPFASQFKLVGSKCVRNGQAAANSWQPKSLHLPLLRWPLIQYMNSLNYRSKSSEITGSSSEFFNISPESRRSAASLVTS